MQQDDSQAGKRFGRYEIIRELGRGGMGVVYKAYDLALERKIALKIPAAHLAQDPVFVRRFIREARSAAQLSHPNIVHIYSVGHHEGTYYIAMEYVRGKSLNKLIQLHGRLDVGFALEVTRQTADALAEAHRHSIIHRDIKPHNVMVDSSNRVKVMDFGLARVQTAYSNLTMQQVNMGTPNYLSPERVQGSEADARSDIYALGVTLFEMLTGRHPFKGETPLALMYQIVNDPFPSLLDLTPSVPSTVTEVFAKMVAKRPEDRYGSAEEVVADLDRLLGKGPGRAGYTDGETPIGGIRFQIDASLREELLGPLAHVSDDSSGALSSSGFRVGSSTCTLKMRGGETPDVEPGKSSISQANTAAAKVGVVVRDAFETLRWPIVVALGAVGTWLTLRHWPAADLGPKELTLAESVQAGLIWARLLVGAVLLAVWPPALRLALQSAKARVISWGDITATGFLLALLSYVGSWWFPGPTVFVLVALSVTSFVLVVSVFDLDLTRGSVAWVVQGVVVASAGWIALAAVEGHEPATQLGAIRAYFAGHTDRAETATYKSSFGGNVSLRWKTTGSSWLDGKLGYVRFDLEAAGATPEMAVRLTQGAKDEAVASWYADSGRLSFRYKVAPGQDWRLHFVGGTASGEVILAVSSLLPKDSDFISDSSSNKTTAPAAHEGRALTSNTP